MRVIIANSPGSRVKGHRPTRPTFDSIFSVDQGADGLDGRRCLDLLLRLLHADLTLSNKVTTNRTRPKTLVFALKGACFDRLAGFVRLAAFFN